MWKLGTKWAKWASRRRPESRVCVSGARSRGPACPRFGVDTFPIWPPARAAPQLCQGLGPRARTGAARVHFARLRAPCACAGAPPRRRRGPARARLRHIWPHEGRANDTHWRARARPQQRAGVHSPRQQPLIRRTTGHRGHPARETQRMRCS